MTPICTRLILDHANVDFAPNGTPVYKMSQMNQNVNGEGNFIDSKCRFEPYRLPFIALRLVNYLLTKLHLECAHV